MIAKPGGLFYNETKDTAATVHIYVISIFDGVVNCGDSCSETISGRGRIRTKKDFLTEVFFVSYHRHAASEVSSASYTHA